LRNSSTSWYCGITWMKSFPSGAESVTLNIFRRGTIKQLHLPLFGNNQQTIHQLIDNFFQFNLFFPMVSNCS
jgi:hypothetical protein